MADTNTAVLDLLLMEIDSHENDWGDQTNSSLTIISRAIGATVSHAVSTGVVTLTRDNVKDAFHRITGALSGNVTIEVPATEPKTYWWKNETSGAFTVTVKVTGQTGVVVPQGDTKLLRCNGTDVVDTGVASTFGIAAGSQAWVGTFAYLADAYSVATALTYVPDTLVDGLTIRGLINNANTTTTPTLQYGTGAAKTIVLRDGSAVAVGEMQPGWMAEFIYRTADAKWHWMNPPSARTRGLANFFGPVAYATTTLTDAATIAWDLSTGTNFSVTITNNRTLGAFTNGTAGQQGFLTVIEDGTGGWTLDLSNGAYTWPAGGAIEKIITTANSQTVYRYKVLAGGTTMLLERVSNENIGEHTRDLLGPTTAAAGATNQDFDLRKWIAAGYERFEIEFEGIAPSVDNTELWLRISTDGGATFNSGASSYSWGNVRTGGGFGSTSNSSDTQIKIVDNASGSGGMSSNGGETTMGTLTAHLPQSGSENSKFTWEVAATHASGVNVMSAIFGAGNRRSTTNIINALRFTVDSGTFSGNFRIYGMRK